VALSRAVAERKPRRGVAPGFRNVLPRDEGVRSPSGSYAPVADGRTLLGLSVSSRARSDADAARPHFTIDPVLILPALIFWNWMSAYPARSRRRRCSRLAKSSATAFGRGWAFGPLVKR